jgi:hypothetical protein
MRQGDPVDILEIAAHRQSPGQSGNPDAQPGEKLLDIRRGDLPFHRGIGRQNDLPDAALLNPVHQPIEPERFRADTVKGGEVSPQYVIVPPKIGGPVYHGHRRGLFHNANQAGIPPRITADTAWLLFREVPTLLAGSYPLGDERERGREPACLFGRLLKKMKREPLGRFPADSREPGEFGDQLLDRAHRSKWRCEGQLRHLPHLSLEHFRRPALSLGHCGEHQVAEKIRIVVLEHCRIDRHGPHRAPTVSRYSHHPAARGGLDGAVCQLGLELLEPALHLLTKLKQLLKICHTIG